MLTVIWRPFWYELDQSIVVGDIDFFYLTKDKSQFSNGLTSEDDYEIKAEILDIKHSLLGSVKGIITIGLDYTVYLDSGDSIQVDAEESPGKITEAKYEVDDWDFEVDIRIIDESGISSRKRLNTMSKNEINALNQRRKENYKRLLT